MPETIKDGIVLANYGVDLTKIRMAEMLDPFAPDYGMEIIEFPYEKGKTLRYYLEKHYDDLEGVIVYRNLLRETDFDIEVSSEDGFMVSKNIGVTGIYAAIVAVAEYFGASAATAAMIGYVGTAVVVIGAALLSNTLLAPSMPDTDKNGRGADNAKAYQWGQITNTARQMIPHSIGLGTFGVAGNLVASRTESYNVEKAGYSVQETVYLLFSLSGNKLYSMENVTINGMEASSFADDDISIYYTKGENTQAALNTETSLSFLPSDPVAPASKGPLFPALGTEFILNQELQIPNHNVSVSESGSVFIGYNHGPINENASIPIKLESALSKTETISILASYLTMFGYSIDDFTGHSFPCFAAVTSEELSEYVYSTEFVLISSIADAGITNPGADDETQHLTLTIQGERELPQSFSAGNIQLITATPRYRTTYVATPSASGTWDIDNYVPTSSWTAYTSNSSEIEDLEFQFVLPKGMFFQYGGTHSGKDAGVKFPRWESYAFHILQIDKSSGATVSDILFTPPDDGQDLSIIANYRIGPWLLPRGFYTYGVYHHAHSFSIKATDILREKVNFPSLYSSPSGTVLSLDGNGFLPTGYKYQIKTRIHGHGCQGRKIGMFYSTIGPEGDGNNSMDIYETRLYRIRELDYGEVLRYPNMSLLAVVLNSTPTVNGRMPTVVAKCKFSQKYYDGSAWVEGYTQNPAELCLGIAYDSLNGGGIGGNESDVNKESNLSELLDLPKWREFADFCDKLITDTSDPLYNEKNYIFNGVIDAQRSFWDALCQICSVAHAVPYFDRSRLSVYWEADRELTQVFNSAMIKEGSFSEFYINSVDTADALNGSFVDEDTNEKTAINWIFPLGSPLKSTSIELIGITNKHRALRNVQYELNKTNITKKGSAFEISTTALECAVGDVIAAQNDYVDWGNADIGGLVTLVDGPNSKITLDRIFPTPSGTMYILLRGGADDTIQSYSINNWDNTGSKTVVTVTTGTGLTSFTSRDPFLIGEGVSAFHKYVVSNVDIHGDISMSLTCFEYIEQAQLDSGLFTISTTNVPGITKENFCPRNITLVPDLAKTEVAINWAPPLIAQQTIKQTHFDILRYQVWRRRGSAESFDLVGETVSSPYTDQGLAAGSHYFYKVIPIFDYYGAEATIPLSWCSNFTDSGNQDVDDGIDFTWSVFEYLPLPELSTNSDHPNGYLVTQNKQNPTLVDVTMFIKDPGNWRYKNASEGYGFWCRTALTNDILDWFGPTGITLSSPVVAGASTIQVNTTSGLTIPGLVILGSTDIVYIHSASGNTLTVGHPSYFAAGDVDRKFTVGANHLSGESVYNGHKGFFPVRYFGFAEDVSIISSAKQLTCSNIYKYDILSNSIVSGADLKGVEQIGSKYYRPVYSAENRVGFMGNVTASTFASRGIFVPTPGDFSINLAYFDITGRPNGVYSAVWLPGVTWVGEIKKDKNEDLFFTIQGIPPAEHFWFAVNRVVWDAEIGQDTAGWTSHIKPIGI